MQIIQTGIASLVIPLNKTVAAKHLKIFAFIFGLGNRYREAVMMVRDVGDGRTWSVKLQSTIGGNLRDGSVDDLGDLIRTLRTDRTASGAFFVSFSEAKYIGN
jgi:hypothetical protein